MQDTQKKEGSLIQPFICFYANTIYDLACRVHGETFM